MDAKAMNHPGKERGRDWKEVLQLIGKNLLNLKESGRNCSDDTLEMNTWKGL